MTMSNGLSDREEFLESEIAALERRYRDKVAQLAEAQRTIQILEDVIHRASKIAGHIPYLCSALEGSSDLENAAVQLQTILLRRT